MSKFNQIVEGWVNHIFPSEEIKKLAETRAKICSECPKLKNNFCSKELGGCGCYIPAKTKSPDSTCPDDKW